MLSPVLAVALGKVTDDQVSAIREMKAEGKAVAKIARATGLSRPTVYWILENTASK